MKRQVIILAVALMLTFPDLKAAFIGTKEFAAELKNNKDLVLIDVLAADAYARQHIKGAINIPHKDLYKLGGFEGELKAPAELATIFGDKGVGKDSHIIIYDDGSQKYNSRVWWILKYLGATDVNLLHKEMGELEQSRIPLTNSPTLLKPVTFSVQLNAEMNISMAGVKAQINKPDAILLDAREKDEFDGMDKDKRSKGHIPGAKWMNFKEVLTSTGDFKTKEEIISTASKFGIDPGKEIVVYCQTGIKAATLYVALHEIAGFANVKLYAGAYAEWAASADNPIIK